MQSTTDEVMRSFAWNSLGSMLVSLVCIGLAWWGLQQFRFDLFLKRPSSPAAKTLMVFISITLGYEVARFILDYFGWSGFLKGLF